MNDREQLEAMQVWLDTHPSYRLPRDPTTNLDEQTLRVMHGGFSKGAIQQQRRPVPVRVDELGWGSDGRYYATQDGAA